MPQQIFLGSQSVTVAAHQWDNDFIIFDGTAAIPWATIQGSNSLASLAAVNTGAAYGLGGIVLSAGATLATHNITVNDAALTIAERRGASFTLNGNATIAHGATLAITGGNGAGGVVLNGTMTVDGTSNLTLDKAALHGTGSVHLTGESAFVRLGAVDAGETVQLDGGMLALTDAMHFLGTIDSAGGAPISPFAAVELVNATTAAQEVFNRATGMLDLYDAQGTQVAHLHFGGQGDVYASAGPGGAMVLSTHPADAMLPVTFLNA